MGENNPAQIGLIFCLLRRYYHIVCVRKHFLSLLLGTVKPINIEKCFDKLFFAHFLNGRYNKIYSFKFYHTCSIPFMPDSYNSAGLFNFGVTLPSMVSVNVSVSSSYCADDTPVIVEAALSAINVPNSAVRS